VGLLDRLATSLAGGEDLPDEPRAEVERAFAEGAAGDWAGAVRRLRAATERHRDLPALFVALGDASDRAGDDEAAVAAFGRAVDLSPHMVDGWLGLGEALVRLGRFEPAREAMRKVLARTLEPSRRARAHAGRGRIALALRESARAVRELREAADLAPLDPGIAHDLGRALLAENDPEASSWLARAAHAPDPDPDWILAAAEAAPSPAIARALLSSGLDVIGEGRPVERAQMEAALCRLLVKQAAFAGAGADGAGGQSELDAAEALARAAISHAPSAPVGEQVLSVLEETRGRIPAALAAAERALALGAVLDLPRLLRLALTAQDRAACLRIAEAAARNGAANAETARLLSAARAFAQGIATDDDLVALGLLVDTPEAREFVADAASPGPVPEGGSCYALLGYAQRLATSTPALASLVPLTARAVEAFDRPLLIAVMGEFNAGKSSFVNALCGEAVAEVGVTPTTATINVLRYGPRGGRILYHDGRAEDVSPTALAGFFAGLSDQQAGAIRLVEIFRPLELLSRVEIVDTPGLNSLRPEHEAIARGFLNDADAIVWLFAVGQAGKATERDALTLARAAQKRVLGVLNKADQASEDELAEIERHVTSSLGDLVEVVVPLSVRGAIAAQKAGATATDDGGLAGVIAALEERFFRHARDLKAKSALVSLSRFVAEAGKLTASASMNPDGGGAAPNAGDTSDLHARLRAALGAREETMMGVLAAMKLATRARLESGFRQAAAELADTFEPRPVRIIGERGPSPDEDRRFAIELLEDAVFEATSFAARELEAAAVGGPPLPIARAIERFSAYARGVFRGGRLDQILGPDGPGAAGLVKRPDPGKLARALIAIMPDVDAELFTPLSTAVTAAFAEARAAADEAERRAALRRLIQAARVERPLADLAAAVRVNPTLSES
jgi:tetratricopeptide (TPR) repeat protein/GTPase SAR1 family protein